MSPIQNMIRYCLLFLSILCALSGHSAQPGSDDRATNQVGASYVIGVSPYLDKAVKDEVYRSIVRLLVADLPLNSSLELYDAYNLKTIARVALPRETAFASPKTRANQFGPDILALKSFLATDHPRPTQPRLNFAAAIRLPQFLDFLAQSRGPGDIPLTLLIFGSPLYQDAKEPAFSMVEGYFPSDGHLQATRDQSIFGLTSSTSRLAPLVVDWVYFGDPWLNELHQEKVTRFWTLYLERRGAQLGAFTSDLATAIDKFRAGAPGLRAMDKGWRTDKSSKLEMLRVGRNVEVTDWLMSERLPDPSPPPPIVMNGPMKIGIRWKPNIDLDLYATPRPDAETLFFRHVRSPEGFYNKDHRSSPGKEYEFIEFDTPIDLREVEAFVNFYKGEAPGGPSGEVRIEFGGRVYGGPFSIPAEEGNLGRRGRSEQRFWTRIPIRELLGLAPAG